MNASSFILEEIKKASCFFLPMVVTKSFSRKVSTKRQAVAYLYESIGFPYSLNTVNLTNLFEFYESNNKVSFTL